MLYSGGSDFDKSNFLFSMLESVKTGSIVYSHSVKLLTTIEHLTSITSIVVGEILVS